MSFGIKATGTGEAVVARNEAQKSMRKMVSGEAINSAGDDAANFAGAVTAGPERSHSVANPVVHDQDAGDRISISAGERTPQAAAKQVDDKEVAVESSKKAAVMIQEQSQAALKAQFNAQTGAALKLLA